MIIKSSTRGSRGLGAHLMADENEAVRVTAVRGIVTGHEIDAAIAELTALGAGSRTRSPLVHASMSPDQSMTEKQWHAAWQRWEDARGLTGQPCYEVEHQKRGRVHRHRVYCRVDIERGAVIRQSHERRINERVARQIEVEMGRPITAGAHSRAVQQWARQHGDTELAAAVADAAAQPRPEAAMPQAAWQQQERTGVNARALADAVTAAWQQSDSAAAFRAALIERGLVLAQGRKTPQVVDVVGEAHDLRRTLRAGGERVTAAQVRVRLPADLPSVAQAAATGPTAESDPDSVAEARQRRDEAAARVEQLQGQAVDAPRRRQDIPDVASERIGGPRWVQYQRTAAEAAHALADARQQQEAAARRWSPYLGLIGAMRLVMAPIDSWRASQEMEAANQALATAEHRMAEVERIGEQWQRWWARTDVRARLDGEIGRLESAAHAAAALPKAKGELEQAQDELEDAVTTRSGNTEKRVGFPYSADERDDPGAGM